MKTSLKIARVLSVVAFAATTSGTLVLGQTAPVTPEPSTPASPDAVMEPGQNRRADSVVPAPARPASPSGPQAGRSGFRSRYGGGSYGGGGGYGSSGVDGRNVPITSGTAGAFGGGGYYGGTFAGFGVRSDAVSPVIIDFTSSDASARQEIEEDLIVMGHILDQTVESCLGNESPPSRMGVPLLLTGGQRGASALYLEGFGAVFMISVNIPLLGPPEPPAGKTRQTADSEWESARREILGLRPGEEGFGSASGTPFDSDQVNALRDALTQALKNAANIRRLKPDECVSVAVFGSPVPHWVPTSGPRSEDVEWKDAAGQELNEPASSPRPTPGTPLRPQSRRRATLSSGVAMAAPLLDGGSDTATILTLRVKKSDATALEKGDLRMDGFVKQVTTLTYPGRGCGVAGATSWIQIRQP